MKLTKIYKTENSLATCQSDSGIDPPSRVRRNAQSLLCDTLTGWEFIPLIALFYFSWFSVNNNILLAVSIYNYTKPFKSLFNSSYYNHEFEHTHIQVALRSVQGRYTKSDLWLDQGMTEYWQQSVWLARDYWKIVDLIFLF